MRFEKAQQAQKQLTEAMLGRRMITGFKWEVMSIWVILELELRWRNAEERPFDLLSSYFSWICMSRCGCELIVEDRAPIPSRRGLTRTKVISLTRAIRDVGGSARYGQLCRR